MSEALYTQTVTLPTQGKLNPEIEHGIVTQRIMKVADKKFLAGTKADGDKVVEGLIQRCTVNPEKLDVGNLINPDMLFLLLKLRILSYGDNYEFKIKCPECGERITVRIKLSDIVVHELPDDFESKLEVTLPHKGDKVYTKFMTIKEHEEVRKEAKRLKKKFSDMQGDPAVTLKIARMITKIELKEANNAGDTELTDPVDILKYVEDLTDLDCIAIESTVENIKVGIDPIIEHECPECEEWIEVGLAFNAEFFRPKYDR